MQPIKQTNPTYETKKLSYATYPTSPLVHYAKIKKISIPMFIMQHIRNVHEPAHESCSRAYSRAWFMSLVNELAHEPIHESIYKLTS